MGKRVYVKHLAMGMGQRPDGSLDLRPHEQYAHLSCGHRGGRVSFFSCMGEPFWCKECESTCLACGEPSTTCFDNSLEWGEACAECAKLDEPEWRSRVRARRLQTMPAEKHIENAAHFFGAARQYLKDAADSKHKFWRYPKNFPLWISHTRAGRRESAKQLFVKGVMHALFALKEP